MSFSTSCGPGSAVAYFQPRGSFKLAENVMSSAFQPLGYSNTWFQLMTASLSVAEDPEENPPANVAGERKSRSARTSFCPVGTSRLIVHPSSRSRRHLRV